ncbi:MAG TPA: AtpZ/AtpI family protein [Phycisphaerae bacterium]|nr:AtpZ/AtpI family protein [Phycisphaerae bacterium]
MGRRDSGGIEYLKWGGLGFEFAGVVAIFTYFGYLADQRWHCEPWGIICGSAVGLLGGIYWLVKESLVMLKDLGQPRNGDHDEQGSERND